MKIKNWIPCCALVALLVIAVVDRASDAGAGLARLAVASPSTTDDTSLGGKAAVAPAVLVTKASASVIQPSGKTKRHAISEGELKALVAPVAQRFPGSVVVGIVDGSERDVVSFPGTADGVVNGDTVFELASVTKTFSGLLLAQAAARGEVQLDQPVQELVGNQLVPHFGAQQIKLKQLATHTASLPEWPSNRGATTSPYSTAEFGSYLKSSHLQNSPGTKVSYSNTGYTLLGYALGQRYQKNFEELVLERICTPLGMNDTHVSLTKSMRARLIGGHTASGGKMPSSSPTADGGADGLRSTGNDMVKLVAALASPDTSPFPDAVKLMCRRYYQHNSDLDIGLGVYKDLHTGIVWKGGFLAGYRTYIAVLPQQQLGVVVLASCNAFPSAKIGDKILLQMARSTH